MSPPASADEGYQRARELYQQGRRDQAESQLRRFLQRSPRHAGANNLMAILLLGQGRTERARDHAENAVAAEPRQVAYLNTLGVVLTRLKSPAEAVEIMQRAVQIHPGYPPLRVALGIALADLGDIGAAEASFRAAVQIQPRDPNPRTNLARLLLDAGRADEAVAELRAALEAAPEHGKVLSDLAGALNYIEAEPEYTLAIHRRLGASLAAAAGEAFQHTRMPTAGRRLRVGYLSADFRAHSVAFFIEPLLRAHDRRRFEIYAYHASVLSDDVSRRLKSLAERWRDVGALDDRSLADLIRHDKLDVLIDLGGHTQQSRIAVLARRPAPIQINWCGYPNTTGLSTIDYRIVDEATDPPRADAMATEKLIRLPRCFLCYGAPPNAPEPAGPPSLKAGHVVFGSFNMLPKVGDASIALWSDVLKAVPDSRLIIKARGAGRLPVRERLLAAFASRGIETERLELLEFVPDPAAHMALYHGVDIALDTYPYHGTTTTCEALWMGVPVVIRVGGVHASRVGLSLLNAAGLKQLAGETPEQTVEIAARLAADRQVLAELRHELRPRLAASALCDATDFARQFEAMIVDVVGARR